MSIVKQSILTVLATLGLHAAILDDLVEKVSHYTSHPSHKHHYRYHKHAVHTLSKEMQWQYALKFLGYYHEKIDGDLLTQASYNAIEAFQRDHQAFATGLLENRYKPYLSDIYREIALQQDIVYDGNNKERLIRKKQAALHVLGYYHGKIDGKFGAKSKAAWADAIDIFQDAKTIFEKAQKDVEERLQKMKTKAYFALHYKDEEAESDEVAL